MVTSRFPWSPPPEAKTCRYCFKEIPGRADVCPLCGETVVRVSPAMVKTLVIVISLAFLIMGGGFFYHKLVDDPRVVREDHYTQGLARGREVGRQQGARDVARGRPPVKSLPARLETFLKNKEPAFREGFKSGFFQEYGETYKNTPSSRGS